MKIQNLTTIGRMSNKISQICPICTCYMLEYTEYPGFLRCCCGNAIKLNKKIINVITEKDHKESAEQYYRNKRKKYE